MESWLKFILGPTMEKHKNASGLVTKTVSFLQLPEQYTLPFDPEKTG
jgi:hypothetical protein